MTRLPSPPVAELVRVDTTSADAAVRHLREYYAGGGGTFNYLPAHRHVGAAFRGLHSLDQLRSSLAGLGNRAAIRPNTEVVDLVAPLAFGRKTQVIRLPHYAYPFARDREAPYRLSFLYVERGMVRAFFLQPRRAAVLTPDQFGGLARIVRDGLLSQLFPGDPTDVDMVDVSVHPGGKARALRTFTLDTVRPWSTARLVEHLTVVVRALETLERDGYTASKRRARPLTDPGLPLFDR